MNREFKLKLYYRFIYYRSFTWIGNWTLYCRSGYGSEYYRSGYGSEYYRSEYYRSGYGDILQQERFVTKNKSILSLIFINWKRGILGHLTPYPSYKKLYCIHVHVYKPVNAVFKHMCTHTHTMRYNDMLYIAPCYTRSNKKF